MSIPTTSRTESRVEGELVVLRKFWRKATPSGSRWTRHVYEGNNDGVFACATGRDMFCYFTDHSDANEYRLFEYSLPFSHGERVFASLNDEAPMKKVMTTERI